MTNRRNFLKQLVATGVVSGMPGILGAASETADKTTSRFHTPVSQQQDQASEMIWATLLHLSYNMWRDNVPLKYKDENYNCVTCQETREWAWPYRPFLTFDDSTWNALLKEMVPKGVNMVVIDLGDGVQYESHPEIAVKNAWTKKKLSSELTKMRKMGLEPIPKLNFATTHDIWMGEYSRMVSTKKYYEVCKNLISEVAELFDNPRFFHLGMDEETASMQASFDYAVVRQNDLWWHDFYLLVDQVERKGARSWIWSDYAWHYPDLFFNKMPKSVLQSNWYYGESFVPNEVHERQKVRVNLYKELERHGYDQVPTGSNHGNDLNIEKTVEYCNKIIDPSRLYGFMAAPWRPTLPQCLDRHKNAINQLGKGRKKIVSGK